MKGRYLLRDTNNNWTYCTIISKFKTIIENLILNLFSLPLVVFLFLQGDKCGTNTTEKEILRLAAEAKRREEERLSKQRGKTCKINLVVFRWANANRWFGIMNKILPILLPLTEININIIALWRLSSLWWDNLI